MFIGNNPLSKIVIMLTTILFIFVFITEWRTWIDTIRIVGKIRLKRIRKNK
jgi:hypothetical protein